MYNRYHGAFSTVRIKYFRRIAATIPTNATILDLGCGQGDFLQVCQQLKLKATGIDPSENWVKHCRHLHLDTKLGTAEKIPFASSTFDVVFSQSVLEHISNPLIMMSEIHRVLKPHGLIIISAPTPENDFWDDPTHIRPYTPKSLRTLLEMTKFTNIQGNYVFSFILGFQLKSSLIYKLLNLLPFPFGSNLIFYAHKS
jgi:2-polyprenyl-3-methyl-5-hydroxy-6-metoxy-1,4-benzoquinol methylase